MGNERIMIVDDNREFCEELQETLRLCGYDAKVVTNSLLALKAARRLRPSLILLDLRMNRKNGFQVAEELKFAKETSAIPIIAMSGYFPVEKDSVLDFSKMNSSIKKPFGITDLVTQIESILDSGEREELAVD